MSNRDNNAQQLRRQTLHLNGQFNCNEDPTKPDLFVEGGAEIQLDLCVDGNVFGNVCGNLKGDVIGNVVGNVVGDVCGNLKGDVTGNLMGNVIHNNNPQQVKYPKGYLCGFRLVCNNDFLVDIQEGGCRDTNDSFNICTTSTLNANITLSGVNGLDTNSESSATWYAVHVIADSTETNAPASLLSTSGTSPVLPMGYDVFRRVGWVRNNLSSNFKPFIQKGTGKSRMYCYDTNRLLDNLLVIVNGQASVWTILNISGQVPPGICYTHFQFEINTSHEGDDFAFRPTGSKFGSAVGVQPNDLERAFAPKNIQLGFTTGPTIFREFRSQHEMCTGFNEGLRAIDYVTEIDTPGAGLGLDVYVTGFEDDL